MRLVLSLVVLIALIPSQTFAQSTQSASPNEASAAALDEAANRNRIIGIVLLGTAAVGVAGTIVGAIMPLYSNCDPSEIQRDPGGCSSGYLKYKILFPSIGVALIGGTIGVLLEIQASKQHRNASRLRGVSAALSPWVGPGEGGLVLSGRF